MDSVGFGVERGTVFLGDNTEQPINKTAAKNKNAAVRFINLLFWAVRLTFFMRISKSIPIGTYRSSSSALV